MATIQRFEDIEAWKKARILTRRVFELTRRGEVSRDFGYRDQIRRASHSIMLNIAEGFESECGDKTFRRHLSIAKGSAGEVRSALYTGLDCGYLSQAEFDELFQLSIETIRLISRFITYLEGPN
jgi:four helix bundle protein